MTISLMSVSLRLKKSANTDMLDTDSATLIRDIAETAVTDTVLNDTACVITGAVIINLNTQAAISDL